MPTISFFRGIKIYINWNDHMPPHFHATYGGKEILVSIHDIEILEGELPSKQEKMVLGWAAFHQTELEEDWYIKKGFSKKMAEYFVKGRRKIAYVQPNNDFTLLLTFDNGEKRIFNVKPLIKKNTVFETLLDWNKFKQVYLDSDGTVCWDKDSSVDSNIFWNNKIDLSTDSLYIESLPQKC